MIAETVRALPIDFEDQCCVTAADRHYRDWQRLPEESRQTFGEYLAGVVEQAECWDDVYIPDPTERDGGPMTWDY